MPALTLWNTQTAIDGNEGAVIGLVNGGYAVVYSDGFQVYVQRYDGAGDAAGAPSTFAISGIRFPEAALTVIGQPVLVAPDQAGASIDILPLTPGLELLTTGSIPITTLLGGSVDVQPLPGGGFAIAWSARIDALDPTSVNVYFQLFDDAATPASAVLRANVNVAGSQINPSMAVLDDGAIVLVWRDTSAGSQARIFEADGTARTGELPTPDADGAPLPPEISALADGGFVLAWRQSGNAYVQRYDAQGNAGPTVVVGAATAGGALGSPVDVLGLPDGGFVVASLSDSPVDGARVVLTRFDADGAPYGDPLEVLAAPASAAAFTGPSLSLMADGRIAVSVMNSDFDEMQTVIVDPRESGVGLTGTGLADDFWGTDFGDTMMGGGGNDLLRGDAGNDRLDGGSGADHLVGGAGNDTYVVDSAGDVVDELAGEGIDTVETARASYALGADVERLVGTWTRSQTLTGNALDNRITGGVANDHLYGLAGLDQLIGGLGADVMEGGAGDDIYYVDDAGDVVIEAGGEGADQVRATVTVTLAANVESLVLEGAGNIGGTGNSLANTLDGNSGANVMLGGGGADLIKGHGGADSLDGEGGADQLLGGDGADTLVGGADADRLQGDAGADLLLGGTGADILEGGSEVDTLHGEDGTDQLFGDAGADVLYGGADNDRLDGGAGADRMEGGAGDDNYFVDNVFDQIVELAAEGVDTVRASIGWTLGEQVERLVLDGTAGLAGTGNGLANILTGNGAGNSLLGLAGSDQLFGGGGDDLLDGGAGGDMLSGAAGRDVFRFGADAVLASTLGGLFETDQVVDLDFAGGDRVDLTGIDADIGTAGEQAFAFVSAFSGQAGQAVLSYVAASSCTLLRLDVDGDGLADLQVRFTGDATGGAVLTGLEPAGQGGWLL
ncbi:MAG TPA: calcium-binding protein [Caulobacter sp.]|nr:calcium-binding protein [Caulobacter sp.]